MRGRGLQRLWPRYNSPEPTPITTGTQATTAPVQAIAAAPTSHAANATSPPVETFSAGEFWARAVSGDPGVIDYGSLREMATMADVTVVATPTSIVKGRDVPGDDTGGEFGYFATVFLDVEEVVAGTIVQGDPHALKMEVFLGAGDPKRNDYTVAFVRYAASLPSERALLFLTNKGNLFKRIGLQANAPGGGYDYYMIASDQAYVRDVEGVADLGQAAPKWLADLRGDPFTDVVADVKALD